MPRIETLLWGNEVKVPKYNAKDMGPYPPLPLHPEWRRQRPLTTFTKAEGKKNLFVIHWWWLPWKVAQAEWSLEEFKREDRQFHEFCLRRWLTEASSIYLETTLIIFPLCPFVLQWLLLLTPPIKMKQNKISKEWIHWLLFTHHEDTRKCYKQMTKFLWLAH